MSADLLPAIMAASATAARERARAGRAAVERRAAERSPRGDLFQQRLTGASIQVIAECKRRSPSKGVLRVDYDPAAMATSYAGAGAAAISVLTEPTFFDGALEHLERVRAVVDVPILRKDFISDPFQLVEARAAGADAVLLIVAGLTDSAIIALLAHARSEGLAALVEVHSREELHRAAGAGASIIGVNSRNLSTLEVDLSLHGALRADMPSGSVTVAESGLTSAADLRRLHGMGYDACLMGERLMTTGDPGHALRTMLEEVACS